MQHHIHHVISGGILAGDQVVEIKTEKRQLSKIKGIEKMRPLRRIRDVGVISDEDIIKMERIIKGSAEKDNAGHQQSNCDSACLWVIA